MKLYFQLNCSRVLVHKEEAIINYVIPLITSFGIVYMFVPLLRMLAIRIGFVDQPSTRKTHAKP